MQHPSVAVQHFATEKQEPTHLPRSPPLSRGSGAVVESPLLDPLLLHQETKGRLDTHIQRKRLQLLWRLPHLVRRSLEQSVPALPGFLACTAPQEATDHQRPLFKAERQQALEHHLREKMVHHKWGLPERIQRALQGPLPSEPSLVVPSAQPGRPAAAPSGWSDRREPGPAATRTPLGIWTRVADGSQSFPKAIPGTGLAEEPSPLDSGPFHLVQQLGESCPQKGLSASEPSCSPCSPPDSTQSAPLHEPWSTPEEEGLSGLNPQDWDRQEPCSHVLCVTLEGSSSGTLPLAKATSLQRRPATVMKMPLQKLEVAPQKISETTDALGWLLQTSHRGTHRMTFVPAKMRISRTPARAAVAFNVQTKPAFEQVGPRALQLTEWLGRGQKQADATEFQERTLPGARMLSPGQLWSPLEETGLRRVHQESPGPVGPLSCAVSQEVTWEPHNTDILENPFWRPQLTWTGSRATLKGEAGHFPESMERSLNHSGAESQEEGRKVRLVDSRKRYFEFHLREKLLHQRWGVPRHVQEYLLQPITE
ncbi:hypothetical protein JRQ81_005553 [Phrynocephalus forsythii]|uniref:SPATA31 domain-containing protein n=1 Tax=Phrynocephalus forsythii TaxID=171643 RepID=A0A9Q0Y5K6_9SAUR|nr:hypothetical protein JRQ81_005553 [Phrynocephalus forsythii]